MRAAVTFDDVAEVEADEASPTAGRVRQLREWAASPHPDDEVDPAQLLVTAGSVLERSGDDAAALPLFREAVDAEGRAAPDARCYLHHSLLATGARAEADELAAEVRRSKPADVSAYLFIGEGYEGVDDLAAANRWFTLGLTRAEREVAPDDDPDSAAGMGLYLLGIARARVRRGLGFPPDDDDRAALAQQEQLQRVWSHDHEGHDHDHDHDHDHEGHHHP